MLGADSPILALTYSCIAPLVLGFATIGLYLFYFAYRYNMLYVSNADIDTQGRVYIQALQHTTTGCYLLMVCLIGLFAIGTAADRRALGPLILMIIFLVFITLYHITLNQAIAPLLDYLPKNLESEQQALLSQGPSPAQKDSDNNIADGIDTAEKGLSAAASPVDQQQQPNFILKFFRPDKYANYATLRRLIQTGDAETETTMYPPEVERDAYFHPAIKAQAPLLWIPRDDAGVSRQEVQHSLRVIPITDEDAWLDDKNKIHWNEEKGEPPVYEEKIYY